MKNKIKEYALLMITGAAALLLAGCGGKVSEGYYVLTSAVEGDTKVKEEDLSDYALEDSYLVVDEDGDGYTVLFGIPAYFENDTKNGVLSFETGDVNYSASGKKITLSDENISLTFEKSKEDAPDEPDAVELASYSIKGDKGSKAAKGGKGGKKKAAQEPAGDDPDEEDTGDADTGTKSPEEVAAEYFCGDWYGWWTVERGLTDLWNEYEGERFDVMAEIKMNDDGDGAVMTIWDGQLSYEKPLGTIDISFTAGSNPAKGAFTTEGGMFLSNEIEPGEWTVDPGLFPFEDYMLIEAEHYDDEELGGEHVMDFVMHLKKWGASWDDIGAVPPSYDWYKNLVDAGESMPDTIP